MLLKICTVSRKRYAVVAKTLPEFVSKGKGPVVCCRYVVPWVPNLLICGMTSTVTNVIMNIYECKDIALAGDQN